MSKFYFFKTMAEKGRNRLRPLAKQKFESGAEVSQTVNVQSNKEIRIMYPLGTTFGSSYLVERAGYYEAGSIFPLGLRDDEYVQEGHRPPEAMKRAYEEYLGISGSSDAEFLSDEDTGERPDTLLEKMRRNKSLSCPTINEDGFYVDRDDWFLLIRNITNQGNTMMIGATGAGKTELVMLAKNWAFLAMCMIWVPCMTQLQDCLEFIVCRKVEFLLLTILNLRRIFLNRVLFY